MNYIELTNKGITHKYFAFIDAKEMLISQLCEDRGIYLKLIDEYDNEKYPNYSIYICKVKNSNISILKDIFDQLEKKMLITGHTDYIDTCNSIMSIFEKGAYYE